MNMVICRQNADDHLHFYVSSQQSFLLFNKNSLLIVFTYLFKQYIQFPYLL